MSTIIGLVMALLADRFGGRWPVLEGVLVATLLVVLL
jgi:putative Ca2+/H+ antiporter (TMEM165/GDT1 family)